MSYICEHCGKIVEECDKFGSGRFCSRSCANSHNHSEETKAKISASINKKTICERQFCGWRFQTLTAKASHERLCEKNPDRLINSAAYKKRKEKQERAYKTRTGDILDVSNEAIEKYLEEHQTCEICGKTIEEANRWNSLFAPKHLCIDHDHKTLKFRGVLCLVCNRQLGWYEANQEAIERYLNKTK